MTRAAVVLVRAVIAVRRPLLLQARRRLIDVVDLVDRHALVGQVQHVVVEVGVGVALGAHDFLDACVAPARPAVRREHHFGLAAEAIQRRVDVL